MSDLSDILDDISKEPDPLLPKAPRRVWTEADRGDSTLVLTLTREQLFHLIWNIETHLRCYQINEWSDAKEPLEKCRSKLQALWYSSTSDHWFAEITPTPVVEPSEPSGTVIPDESSPSGTSDAEHLLI